MGKTIRRDAKYDSTKFGKTTRKKEQIKKFLSKKGKLVLKDNALNRIHPKKQEDERGPKI